MNTVYIELIEPSGLRAHLYAPDGTWLRSAADPDPRATTRALLALLGPRAEGATVAPCTRGACSVCGREILAYVQDPPGWGWELACPEHADGVVLYSRPALP